MEQALTLTLRKVLRNDRPRVCFTVGHGEPRVTDAGPRGLAELPGKLAKNNYDVLEVSRASAEAPDPFADCAVTVIAGPTQPFTADEVGPLRTWVHAGGNLLVAVGPVFDVEHGASVDLGLDPLLENAGVKLVDDFVFEADPRRKLPGGRAMSFWRSPSRTP